MLSAYHRAKFSAVKIIGHKITSGGLVGTRHGHHSRHRDDRMHRNIRSKPLMTTVSQSIAVQQLCTNSESSCNTKTKDDMTISNSSVNVTFSQGEHLSSTSNSNVNVNDETSDSNRSVNT